MKLIQKMLTVLLVFAGWLTVAQACHEEKNDWLSGHKDKFSTNAITLSTEDTMAFTSTSTSCDAYSFFLHKKYDQVNVEQIIKTLKKNSKNAKSLIKNVINVLPKYINKRKDPAEEILDKSIITHKKNWNKRTKQKLSIILKRYLEKN